MNRLLFRSDRRSFFLRPEEIDWIEGEGNYSRVHSARATFLLRQSITALTSRLEPYGFRRVHRSAIVNVSLVAEVRRRTRYRFSILLSSGVEVPLSPGCRQELQDLLLHQCA